MVGVSQFTAYDSFGAQILVQMPVIGDINTGLMGT